MPREGKFSDEELTLLKKMGWEFIPTGPNEWQWMMWDHDGGMAYQQGCERWQADLEAIEFFIEERRKGRPGRGGFTDGNNCNVQAGDRVEYEFEDHRRGVLDEALQDGDAYVTWDDGAKGTVKWCRLAKIPEQTDEGLSDDVLTVMKSLGWRWEYRHGGAWYLFAHGSNVPLGRSGTEKWSEDVAAAKVIDAARDAQPPAVWEPTMELRWKQDKRVAIRTLQQKWICVWPTKPGGEYTEWRDIVVMTP